MPYYVYQISNSDAIGLIKNLQLMEQFQAFRDAKLKVKEMRAESEPNSEIIYKVIFADNQLMAEEQLLEKRKKPILMEHEI
jgi:hypothetical protein